MAGILAGSGARANKARIKRGRKDMPDSPERNRLILEMEDIVKYYAPWIAPWHDVQYYLEQPWFIGYKQHPIGQDAWEYVDIAEKRPK